MFRSIWFSSVILLLTAGCGLPWSREKGNGQMVRQGKKVDAFSKVEVSGDWELEVTDGEEYTASIEIDENLQPFVEVSQEGDKISIDTRRGKRLSPSRRPKLFLTAPALEALGLSGSSRVHTSNELRQAKPLRIRVSGTGALDMQIHAPEVKLYVSGSGEIDLKGETRVLWLEISGAAEARCYDLLAEKTHVQISGAGEAQVFASVELDARVSGAGGVRFKGDPEKVVQHLSGAGSVKKAE